MRRLPVGAEPQSAGGVHFRVWAPAATQVAVVLGDEGSEDQPLDREEGGYWSGLVRAACAGMTYRFRLDGGAFPDPASRFQPDGPHGPSQIIDPDRFAWSDHAWRGVSRSGQVIYELHIGTFTPEGTWAAAMARLDDLAALGITIVEVMPVADFPGQRGWGYDGVDLFAPTRLYGEPDDFRRFVDRAHALGMGVILDVVYNHLGPDGNYLREFARHYFSERYRNEWGDALNFDDEFAGPVRELFVANAGYWITEFHCDGLRLDATQQIFDASPEHLVAAVARRVREAAGSRGTLVVAENEEQDAALLRTRELGGHGLDAAWNDDFHHSAAVALTGRRECYCSDYLGTPQEFIAAAKWGYLYQGQHYSWQQRRRGSAALDLEPHNFVNYLENHDQVANSLSGRRMHQLTSPSRLRAITALLLLGPNTPMLFQGQEFAASAPFLYFADHHPELAKAVARGRVEFLSQFPSIKCCGEKELPNPEREETFRRCVLDWSERERHREWLHLHRELLALRRDDPVLGKCSRGSFDGAVLDAAAFLLRFFSRDHGDRLLVVNLGRQAPLRPVPEPMLAPETGRAWALAWSSEEPRYGGGGALTWEKDGAWDLPAESAALFVSKEAP